MCPAKGGEVPPLFPEIYKIPGPLSIRGTRQMAADPLNMWDLCFVRSYE